jgi:hypothetical protein
MIPNSRDSGQACRQRPLLAVLGEEGGHIRWIPAAPPVLVLLDLATSFVPSQGSEIKHVPSSRRADVSMKLGIMVMRFWDVGLLHCAQRDSSFAITKFQ